jgi:ABC-2 type transport system ATP-binding protein
MPVVVHTERLTVHRGGHPVLSDLHLTVPSGSVTGLLGPSGSGKTTLLRVAAGLQRISSGTVRVLGLSPGAPASRHRIGYSTQAASVYPDLTVADNVRYHAVLHGRSRGRAEIAMRAVDLAERGDQLVGTLSGGQRIRVSLACALVAEPELLLLDEPTVGLDPLLRRDLWAMFRTLAAEQGATVLVSSHVMEEARHCDRLLLLREGRLVADDTPHGLLTATNTESLDDAFLRLVEAPA